MPTYEYYCRPCAQTFTLIVSIAAHQTEVAKCPRCHGTQVEQLLSTFIAKTSKKS